MRSIYRLMAATILLLAACSTTVLAAGTSPPPLPPLTDPSTDTHIRGKFVWADMFTSDTETAKSFYQGLFGWDWRSISEKPLQYGMFYKNDLAVGGLVHREPQIEGQLYGRWVHYISAEEISEIESTTIAQGGRSLLSTRQRPSRGEFAIMADPQGAIFGAINSSSGDPDDYRAEHGEWIWIQLYARDAVAATNFYATLFGYDIQAQDEDPAIVEWVLAVGDYSRASVGQLTSESEYHPTWLGFIRVEDIDATMKKAKSLGGKVVLAPNPDLLNGDLALIEDPLGTPVGLLRWDFPEEEEDKR